MHNFESLTILSHFYFEVFKPDRRCAIKAAESAASLMTKKVKQVGKPITCTLLTRSRHMHSLSLVLTHFPVPGPFCGIMQAHTCARACQQSSTARAVWRVLSICDGSGGDCKKTTHFSMIYIFCKTQKKRDQVGCLRMQPPR